MGTVSTPRSRGTLIESSVFTGTLILYIIKKQIDDVDFLRSSDKGVIL